jgi:hypothetical protein
MKTLAELQEREEQLIRLIADRASPAGEKTAAVLILVKTQEQLDSLGAPRRWITAPQPTAPRNDRPRALRPFPAKFPGWCLSCGQRFAIGALITAGSEQRRWVHSTCAGVAR